MDPKEVVFKEGLNLVKAIVPLKELPIVSGTSLQTYKQ
jgi:hypothetical protein